MKRLLLAVVTVALLMMYIVPVYADVPGTMYVVNCDEWVSLRATPHTDAERLIKIPLGAKVTNCHQQGKDWIACEYKGKAGYVLSKYLAASASSGSKGAKETGEKIGSMYVVNCDDWVSLRATPSTSADRLVKIPLGARVSNCIRHDKKWIYCEYDGRCGFVLSKYLTSSISSWAKAHQGEGGSMYVVKCNEWVSLRETPSKNADRLRKVPLGAKVSHCVKFDKKWTYCKYDGKYGFVLSEYLSKSAPAKAKEDKKTAAPSTEPVQGAEAADDQVEEGPKEAVVGTLGGYSLGVTRSYQNDGESAEIKLYKGSEIAWTRNVSVPYATELDGICAFLGGTEADPRVMIYAEDKLEAFSCATGESIWTLNRHLGASCTYAVAQDGTMYIGGYYGPDPVAISVDGAELWSADSKGAYWLYKLELAENGLVATYSVSANDYEKEARIVYDYATGALISSEDIAPQQ